MRLSVIVVSYNTRELLRRCLGSLGEADEIIVVDNASTDDSPDMVESEFPNVVLIRNETNRGFGAANNQGLDVVRGDAALLLNSDAYAEAGALSALASALGDPGVVAAGGLLFDPHTQKVQPSCCSGLTLWAVFCEQSGLDQLFSSSRLLSPYWETDRILAKHQQGQSHPVEQVMGACLLMRPVERFDERYFLYCEDTELCIRLRRHGEIVYVPDARFGHELGASSKETRWESVARYNAGKELTFRIHHGPVQAFTCLLLNRLGALLRLAAYVAAVLLTLGTIGRFRRGAGLFWRVLSAPVGGPPRP